MGEDDERDPRAATVRAWDAALRAADLDAIERLLAPDVRWYGAGGGACHNRDEVLVTLREQAALGVAAGHVELLSAGDRVLVRVELTAPEAQAGAAPAEEWLTVATLDAGGRICHLQDYTTAATAERDLALRAAGDAPPAGRVGDLVPFVHVADVQRSADFYELLGFAVDDTYQPGDRLNWASLQSADAALMLALADEPVDARNQGVLFYLYSPDLAGLRDHLVARGVLAGEILDGTPGPRQEMRVIDPDGYCLMIAQLDD